MSTDNLSSELSSNDIEKGFETILIENNGMYVPSTILENKGIAEEFDTSKPTVGEKIFKKAQYEINITLIDILYNQENDSIIMTPKISDGDIETDVLEMVSNTLGEAWMILSLYASKNSIVPRSIKMEFDKGKKNYLMVGPASKFIHNKTPD